MSASSSYSSSNSVSESLPRKRKQRTSWVWEYFEQPTKDFCKLKCPIRNCLAQLEWTGDGTSGLKYHLGKHGILRTTSNPLRKAPIVIMSETESEFEDSDDEDRLRATTTKKSKKITDGLVEFIVTANEPMSLVENDFFKHLLHQLNIHYKMPSKSHLSTVVIPEKYESVKAALEHEIATHLTNCAITTDIWTSNSQNSYLSSTIHFIDNHWRLCSRLLGLIYLDESHEAAYIKTTMLKQFKDWKIDNKVQRVVSDSGANMKKAFKDENLHFACVAHKLNLSVRDLEHVKVVKCVVDSQGSKSFSVKAFNEEGELKNQQISSTEAKRIETVNEHKNLFNFLVAKCRKLVGSFRHSESLNRKLKEKQIAFNYETRTKLVQDVKTRWHSTYIMLDSVYTNKAVLCSMVHEKGNENIRPNLPTDEEFNVINDYCNLLLPLKSVTSSLSGRNYVTISLMFPTIYSLINGSLDQVSLVTETVKVLRDELLDSLRGRFVLILENDFLLATALLHVEYKNFNFILDSHERESLMNKGRDFIFSFSRKLQSLNTSLSNDSDSSSSLDSFSNDEFLSSSTQISSSSTVVTNAPRKKQVPFVKSIANCQQTSNLNVNSLSPIELEFTDYLNHSYTRNISTKSENNEALKFFQKTESQFPILAQVARHLLCVPATSVPSESLFSVAGIIQDDQRNRLKPAMLNMLTFIKYNISQDFSSI